MSKFNELLADMLYDKLYMLPTECRKDVHYCTVKAKDLSKIKPLDISSLICKRCFVHTRKNLSINNISITDTIKDIYKEAGIHSEDGVDSNDTNISVLANSIVENIGCISDTINNAIRSSVHEAYHMDGDLAFNIYNNLPDRAIEYLVSNRKNVKLIIEKSLSK